MAVPRKVYLFLVIGLVAASQSGNIIRLGEASPVEIAAFRLLLATAILAPFAGRRLGLLLSLPGRDRGLLLAAGLALALHFFTWIAAVQLTTVANAATFFSINPVITAAAAYVFFRERAGRALVASIALGIAGVAATGLGDLGLRPEHLAGDGLALLCSLLFTAYFLLGKRLRQALPTSVYVTGVYGVAALFSVLCLVALGPPALDYSPRTWLCFGLMAIVPTVIGHTALNNALGHLDAGWIATATLSEPLLAGLVAYLAWGETVTWAGAAGYGLICLSVVVLVAARPGRGGVARPPSGAYDESG